MITREIIAAAKNGTLVIGTEVQCDPHRPDITIGSRVVWSSGSVWFPDCKITFAEWVDICKYQDHCGRVIGLYYDPHNGYTPGEWSTTATIELDAGDAVDVKTDLLNCIK